MYTNPFISDMDMRDLWKAAPQDWRPVGLLAMLIKYGIRACCMFNRFVGIGDGCQEAK